jgi:DNA-binding Lrp family transcriptional regulator
MNRNATALLAPETATLSKRPLDDKDRRILDLLRGLARSTLRDRLARLEADGIIRGYHAHITEDAPNVSAYLFVRLKSTPAPGLIALLRRMPEVRSCTSLTGDIDLLVEIAAASTDRVNALRDRISTHESVADLTTSIVLDRNI